MRTLRDLQVALATRWNPLSSASEYTTDFQADQRPHRDFEHALIHVIKAAGKLAAYVDQLDHYPQHHPEPIPSAYEVQRYLADFVLCAMHMSNHLPGHVPLDLQSAVECRMEVKNPR
jgi:hypothetical protein